MCVCACLSLEKLYLVTCVELSVLLGHLTIAQALCACLRSCGIFDRATCAASLCKPLTVRLYTNTLTLIHLLFYMPPPSHLVSCTRRSTFLRRHRRWMQYHTYVPALMWTMAFMRVVTTFACVVVCCVVMWIRCGYHGLTALCGCVVCRSVGPNWNGFD